MEATYEKASMFRGPEDEPPVAGFNVYVPGRGMVMQRVSEKMAKQVVEALKGATTDVELAEVLFNARG